MGAALGRGAGRAGRQGGAVPQVPRGPAHRLRLGEAIPGQEERPTRASRCRRQARCRRCRRRPGGRGEVAAAADEPARGVKDVPGCSRPGPAGPSPGGARGPGWSRWPGDGSTARDRPHSIAGVLRLQRSSRAGVGRRSRSCGRISPSPLQACALQARRGASRPPPMGPLDESLPASRLERSARRPASRPKRSRTPNEATPRAACGRPGSSSLAEKSSGRASIRQARYPTRARLSRPRQRFSN